jgi:oligopeptide transport system permease protein
MTPFNSAAATADASTLASLDDRLFERAPALAGTSEQISRPTLTYWQDVWLRISRDHLAVGCALLIGFVALAGVIGPLMFPRSTDGVPFYNQQNVNAIDQSPNLGVTMTVVSDDYGMATDEFAAADGVVTTLTTATSPKALQIVGVPSVNGVTLKWENVPGITGYQIYRSIVPKGFSDLSALRDQSTSQGLQVAEITDPLQISFTDTMGLDATESYAYTIVGFLDNIETGERVIAPDAAAVVASLTRIIKLSDAQTINPSIEIGQELRGRVQLFGTDSMGRDVFARMLQGTRVDMLLALFVPAISILIGLIYGAISGILGKKIDMVMMRIVEIVDNFPDLLFFILLQVAIGKGLFSLVTAMTLFGWAGFARIVRGEVLRMREMEFVQASQILGAPLMRVVLRHVAPNLMGIVIIAWSARIPAVIAFETFLSLLGLGLEQPEPSWGNVVFDAARRLQVNPLQFFLPAGVLAITLLAFYLLGNSLRDAFDPKLRGRG